MRFVPVRCKEARSKESASVRFDKLSSYIRRDELEERLLANLQTDLLQPAVVDFAVAECGRQLRSALANFSEEIVQLRQRKEKLEREIRDFSKAIAEGGHSKYLLDEISARERDVSTITDRLLSAAPDSVESHIDEIRAFVMKEIADLRALLNHDVMLAKAEIRRHVREIRCRLQATEKTGITSRKARGTCSAAIRGWSKSASRLTGAFGWLRGHAMYRTR